MSMATVISKTSTTEITFAITDRTIDTGCYEEYPVTRLRLTYHDTEIAAIGYDTIEDGSPSSAAVHPEYLGKPDTWPDWVRDLVNEHRPA